MRLKSLFLICFLLLLVAYCSPKNKSLSTQTKETPLTASDTVRIANDKIEYEITIIEAGFNAWLASRARPQGYYSQSYLENRNRILVLEWNRRVNQPSRFNPQLYGLDINYRPQIDYGYEVNYMLYNYFIYFQIKYKQQLSSFSPRI